MNSLKAFSRVKGAKYLLVGSFLGKHGHNENIEIGQYFPINLINPPFNLKNYIRIYNENEPKSLILYDIPNYLKNVNFDLIKNKLGNS